jgi:hypothetical protein
MALPFGRHANQPLTTVPLDYLQWCLRTVRLSSGLRAAVADELTRRGVEVPPAEPPRPLPTCRRCPGVTPILHWLQDSLGRRQIKISCGACHASIGFAPQVPPYVEQANAVASKTPVLDVLTRLDEIGVELLSDGKSVRYRPGDWQRVPPDLRRVVAQCGHDLARMLLDTSKVGRPWSS